MGTFGHDPARPRPMAAALTRHRARDSRGAPPATNPTGWERTREQGERLIDVPKVQPEVGDPARGEQQDEQQREQHLGGVVQVVAGDHGLVPESDQTPHSMRAGLDREVQCEDEGDQAEPAHRFLGCRVRADTSRPANAASSSTRRRLGASSTRRTPGPSPSRQSLSLERSLHRRVLQQDDRRRAASRVRGQMLLEDGAIDPP